MNSNVAVRAWEMMNVRDVEQLKNNDENVANFHQMVLNDHRIKVTEISEALKMSKVRVCHIFNQARWVPRFRTLDQKRVRMNICNAPLSASAFAMQSKNLSFGTD